MALSLMEELEEKARKQKERLPLITAYNINEASDPFASRGKRLLAIYYYVERKDHSVRGKIARLHDHKGNLIVVWKYYRDHYQYFQHVRDAWEYVGLENGDDNVHHVFNDRDGDQTDTDDWTLAQDFT